MGKVLRTAYATYPTVKLQGYKTDAKTGEKKFGFIKELLFGDYMRPYIENGDYVRLKVGGKEYVKIRCRNADGYILESEMQEERPLEVNFVDVGQGDGCHIVTPDDKHFIVDAGEGDNMYRFLKWRFNLKTAKTPPPPFTIVMSHPDQDHYAGFTKLFTQTKGTAQQFKFDKVYHNGIVGVPGKGLDALGRIVVHNGQKYVTDLVEDDKDFEACVKKGGNGNFLRLLKKTTASKQALHLGSDPIYKNDKFDLTMDILGPVSETIDGRTAIPVYGSSDVGKTKNGNSVVIKLTMGHLRMLLGGDLNTESEYMLIKRFSGIDIKQLKDDLGKAKLTAEEKQKITEKIDEAILQARNTLEVDIAKSCHHGSADFSSEFLRAINPIATVISSGDEEPHTHPRPDTLGTIGKHSRGDRSLIFSTELARSGKEFVELDKIKNTEKKKERAVTVYGMINVRTDGNRVIIAQKLEAAAVGRNWDVHKLEWNEKTKQFDYLCKYE